MFKGSHFPQEVILETIRYYHAYKLSYREIEEIQLERGIHVDHATINRWVIKYTPRLVSPIMQNYRNLSTLCNKFRHKTLA
tara:strand:+ start:332 stop:574 length:243 start_codon:yes stop_codon:yes gene_type:complete